MQPNTDHIQTTHIGSMIRPPEVLELLEAKEAGEPYDADEWGLRLDTAVKALVRRQVEVGLDWVSDGELSKNSFSNYVTQRLGPFDGVREGGLAALVDAAVPADRRRPTEPSVLSAVGTRSRPDILALRELRVNTGPLHWQAREYEDDIARLLTVGAEVGLGPDRLFMPAVAVGQVAFMFPSDHYTTEEAWLEALAEVMADEYRAIAAAGVTVQIDSPDFVMMRHRQYRSAAWPEYRQSIERRIEALNIALADIPEQLIRFHLCWGNVPGPHIEDVPLRDVLDLLLTVKAGAYSVEAANPRHAHEWTLWRDGRLQDGKLLIPGVIDTVTQHVEHPEVVAQRIIQYAETVGPERVIAAPDCGFGTFVGLSSVAEEIMWLKLEALVEGARLASDRLF